MSELYTESYYKSDNYSNYLERSDRYTALVNEVHILLSQLSLNNGPILDYGCAVGFVIEALLDLKYDVEGVDVSEWALNECRKKNLTVSNVPNYEKQYGIVFALDVLEHLTEEQLNYFIDNIHTKAIIVRVPICLENETDYYFAESNKDKTHIIKWTFNQWDDFFKSKGYITLSLQLKTIYSSLGGYCALCIK